MSGWISICDWRRFQHYDPSKRQPPWIKNYTELMADEDYLSLPGHTRSILHGLWLEYASSRCRLHADSSSLSSRLRLRVTKKHLQSLSDAGFIAIVASKALAEGYQDASARAHVVEAEAEKEVKKQVLTSTVDAPLSRELTEQVAVTRLLEVVGDVDEEGLAKIRGFARRLPEGSIAKVAESVEYQRPRNRIGYAIAALNSELQEQT